MIDCLQYRNCQIASKTYYVKLSSKKLFFSFSALQIYLLCTSSLSSILFDQLFIILRGSLALSLYYTNINSEICSIFFYNYKIFASHINILTVFGSDLPKATCCKKKLKIVLCTSSMQNANEINPMLHFFRCRRSRLTQILKWSPTLV